MAQEGATYDVAIVGAGVCGCAIARELSRYDARVIVIERGEDVCVGTSKANSAIVHAGYDPEPGSLKARLNVEGNRSMGELCDELNVPFKRIGSLVVCTDESLLPDLEALLARGTQNGVPDLRIVGREELVQMEPNISDAAVAALWAPTGGIVCPFELTIALAQNACANGAEFLFDSEVTAIDATAAGTWRVTCGEKSVEARAVVNAAGVYAGDVHAMASTQSMGVSPRRGEYYLLDKADGDYVRHTIFVQPGPMGKGVLVSPTVHGNVLVGPNAEDLDDREATNTTRAGLDDVKRLCTTAMKNVPVRDAITNFAGLRAVPAAGDFVIGEATDAPGFFDCAGIASPGLSASPAIGKMVAGMVAEHLSLTERDDFIETREGPVRPMEMSFEERQELIRRRPDYGAIVCRCESVSEGEIVDAIRGPIGARSLDGVKRRTRAGMGRCQAGFCSPRVMELLARELGLDDLSEVTKSGGDSHVAVGLLREFDEEADNA